MPETRAAFLQNVLVLPARESTSNADILYAYQRSNDSVHSNSPGQDYLTYCYDAERIAFVVCDGVSQSYLGDVAAHWLGDHLLDWLWQEHGISDFSSELTGKLQEWVSESTTYLDSVELPDNLPPVLRTVLDKKKKQSGSQCMFVSGLIDFQEGFAYFFWAGDSKFRTSLDGVSQSERLIFDQHHRWSTKAGLLGISTPHFVSYSIQKSQEFLFTIYTDGIDKHQDKFTTRLGPDDVFSMLQDMQGDPRNDDIAFLQIASPVKKQRGQKAYFLPEHLEVGYSENYGKVCWNSDEALEIMRIGLIDHQNIERHIEINYLYEDRLAEQLLQQENSLHLLDFSLEQFSSVTFRTKFKGKGFSFSRLYRIPVSTLPESPPLFSTQSAILDTTPTELLTEENSSFPLVPKHRDSSSPNHELIPVIVTDNQTAKSPDNLVRFVASGIMILLLVASILIVSTRVWQRDAKPSATPDKVVHGDLLTLTAEMNQDVISSGVIGNGLAIAGSQTTQSDSGIVEQLNPTPTEIPFTPTAGIGQNSAPTEVIDNGSEIEQNETPQPYNSIPEQINITTTEAPPTSIVETGQDNALTETVDEAVQVAGVVQSGNVSPEELSQVEPSPTSIDWMNQNIVQTDVAGSVALVSETSTTQPSSVATPQSDNSLPTPTVEATETDESVVNNINIFPPIVTPILPLTSNPCALDYSIGDEHSIRFYIVEAQAISFCRDATFPSGSCVTLAWNIPNTIPVSTLVIVWEDGDRQLDENILRIEPATLAGEIQICNMPQIAALTYILEINSGQPNVMRSTLIVRTNN